MNDSRESRSETASPELVGHRTSVWEVALLYAVSVGGALILAGLLVWFTGGSWQRVLGALLEGAFFAPGRWGNTLTVAAPLLLVALGMIVGVRAGLFNIGQEGQLLMGAMAMAFVGTKMGGPGPLLLVAGLVAGAIAGGLYAGVAALMRYARQVPEVISTLLLVFVATQIVGYAVTTSWLLRDPDPNRPSRAVSSAPLPEGVRLPVIHLFGNDISSGLIVALVLAAIVAYILARTIWGFLFRVLGSNPRVAQSIGVRASRTGSAALSISGALAGLAGAVMLAAGSSGYRLTTGFSSNIGWEGLLVALLAGSQATVAIPMALLFAALRTGSGFLAATGVDRKIVDVIQALLVMALLLPPAIMFVRAKRRAIAAVRRRPERG
ncbi:MAG: ABC transporter permease [Acidimicrobiia bacterium]